MCPLCRKPLGAIKVELVEGGYAHRPCCDARSRQRRREAIRDLTALLASIVIVFYLGGFSSAITVFLVGTYLHSNAHRGYWRKA